MRGASQCCSSLGTEITIRILCSMDPGRHAGGEGKALLQQRRLCGLVPLSDSHVHIYHSLSSPSVSGLTVCLPLCLGSELLKCVALYPAQDLTCVLAHTEGPAHGCGSLSSIVLDGEPLYSGL